MRLAAKPFSRLARNDQRTFFSSVLVILFQASLSNRSKIFRFDHDDFIEAVNVAGRIASPPCELSIHQFVALFSSEKGWPVEILISTPRSKLWIIVGKGDAQYEFRLITKPFLSADEGRSVTKLHDATPEIVRRFALSDEQAALARIRYNRLVDIFCKCVAHSLQNHLRTKVTGIGQIEIDELYVGANRQGEHFIIPVQAKKKRDRLGVSQLMQDLEYCRVAHPDLRPRALGAQLLKHHEDGKVFDKIVLFEFECRDEPNDVIIRKRAERHFVLLPHGEITASDFKEAHDRQEDADND